MQPFRGKGWQLPCFGDSHWESSYSVKAIGQSLDNGERVQIVNPLRNVQRLLDSLSDFLQGYWKVAGKCQNTYRLL